MDNLGNLSGGADIVEKRWWIPKYQRGRLIDDHKGPYI